MGKIFTIIAKKHSVDYVRKTIRRVRKELPQDKIQLQCEANWLTFWENEVDFMTDEDKKWIELILIT